MLTKITYPVDKGIGLLKALSAQGLRFWEQTDLGHVTPDDGAAVQAIVDAYDPLPEAKAVVIEAVKVEAQTRIEAVAPVWKQINMLWRGLALALQPADKRTPDEQAEIAATLAIGDQIAAVRAASDQVELQVAALTDLPAIRGFDAKAWPE